MAYAVLARRADEADSIEYGMYPHVEEKTRAELCGHREALDAELLAPVGRQAAAEQALIDYLGGVA